MKWFNDLSVRTKLLSAFAGIAFFTAVVGGIGMYNLLKIKKGDNDLYNYSEKAVAVIAQLSTSFQSMRSDERDLILTEKIEDKKAISDKIDARKAEVQKFLEELEQDTDGKDEMQIYENIKKSSEAYFTAQPKTIEHAMAGKTGDAIKSLNGDEETSRNEFQGLVQRLLEINMNQGEFIFKENIASSDLSIMIMLVVTAASFFIALVMGLFISGGICKPIAQGLIFAKKISEGDFIDRVDLVQKDEIGMLANALNHSADKISSAVISFQRMSEELATSAQEMSATNVSLAENAQNAASTVEEVTAAVEEISAGMDMVSGGARDQSDNLHSLLEKMDVLSSSVKEMSNLISNALAMGESIVASAHVGAGALEEMNTSMSTITGSSQDMMNIVKIINDISDQINLLSLNAAIEAARAGDAGRGFAVVADEISKLADQTAQSIKDIDRLIKQNSAEIIKGKGSIDTTTETIHGVTEGISSMAEMIHRISASMSGQMNVYSEIQSQATNVKNRSEEITNAMEEQKIGIKEISQSITSINELTQSNAAGVEEMTGSSENVSLLAENLKKELDYFKVR